MNLPWRVEAASGPAAVLLEPLVADGRTVRVVDPDERAVVLGSTQPESHVDLAAAAAAGMTILRRRSGGGAVLVGPGVVLWVDVFVPAGDPLWTADVGRAFWWLGDVWAAALDAAALDAAALDAAGAGAGAAQVWRGGLVRTSWSNRVCFAGLGPGEVTIGGAKVVGISQRRTRAGAQFQCGVALAWQPSDLLDLLSLDDDARARAAVELAGVARAVDAGVAERLLPAFLEHLP